MTPQDEMKMLAEKWGGKPKPPFMSKEYIDMRIDRVRYIKLRKQYGIQHRESKESVQQTSTDDLVKFAEEIFEEETESQPKQNI